MKVNQQNQIGKTNLFNNYSNLSNKPNDNKSPRRQSYLQGGSKPGNGPINIKLNDMSSNNNEDRNMSNDRSANGENSSHLRDSEKHKFRDSAKAQCDRSIGDVSSHENRLFQNGRETLKFEEFLNMIKDNCSDPNQTENFLILAFSMFDR